MNTDDVNALARRCKAAEESYAIGRRLVDELRAALAAATAENERLKAPWLCDCHTWPGPDEAHEYIVALEALLNELASKPYRAEEIAARWRDPLTSLKKGS
jgi:hypothetical protein